MAGSGDAPPSDREVVHFFGNLKKCLFYTRNYSKSGKCARRKKPPYRDHGPFTGVSSRHVNCKKTWPSGPAGPLDSKKRARPPNNGSKQFRNADKTSKGNQNVAGKTQKRARGSKNEGRWSPKGGESHQTMRIWTSCGPETVSFIYGFVVFLQAGQTHTNNPNVAKCVAAEAKKKQKRSNGAKKGP